MLETHVPEVGGGAEGQGEEGTDAISSQDSAQKAMPPLPGAHAKCPSQPPGRGIRSISLLFKLSDWGDHNLSESGARTGA